MLLYIEDEQRFSFKEGNKGDDLLLYIGDNKDRVTQLENNDSLLKKLPQKEF